MISIFKNVFAANSNLGNIVLQEKHPSSSIHFTTTIFSVQHFLAQEGVERCIHLGMRDEWEQYMAFFLGRQTVDSQLELAHIKATFRAIPRQKPYGGMKEE